MPFIRFILRQLLEPGRTMGGYIVRAWLVQFTGALAFGIVGGLLNLGVGDPRELAAPTAEDGSPLTTDIIVVFFLFLVIATPIVETLMLWGGIILIRRFVTRDVVAVAIVSAAAWGILHVAFNNLPNGVSASWSFFCFTIAFQVGELSSKRSAFLVPCLMHAMTNTIATFALIMAAQSGSTP